MKSLVIAMLVALALPACKFDEKNFGDRTCTIDQDCNRPDLACISGTCAPRTCQAAADCGSEFSFSCTELGCVAQSCSTNDDCGVGYVCNSDKLCQASFNVASAASTSNTSVAVMFDGPPNAAAATTAANYAISGLSINGSPTLNGNTVTLPTIPQDAASYTVTVTGVTRAGDNIALGAASATFEGRAAFDVTGATSTGVQSLVVNFDAAPDMTSATTLANYSVPGLTLSAATVSGSAVTLTTSVQAAQAYNLTVTGVHRASDGEALTHGTAMFGGRNAFDVAAAQAHTSSSVKVTFDAPPNPAQALTAANYAIAGLTVISVVADPNDMTNEVYDLTTSTQMGGTPYSVVVSNVTRASDNEPLTQPSAGFTGIPSFNVVSATSLTSHTVRVTFDAAPDPNTATDPMNYDIQNLTIAGTPTLSGNSVTLTTSAQTNGSFTVTVSNVIRNSDGEPLTGDTTQFTGRTSFNVSGAVSATSTRVIVSFDAPPDPTSAQNLANYNIPGLTLSGTPQLAGSQVTIATSPQSQTGYTVTVANVIRASDAEPMTAATFDFQGRAPFNVTGASPTTSTTVVVSFDAAPNASEATTQGNYNIPGLTLTAAPVLGANNTVILTTTKQANQTYTVIVSGVTRASDGEALTIASANFTGRPPFDIVSPNGAASTSNVSMTVTFDGPPVPSEATNPANYAFDNGLTIDSNGTLTLAGNTVTIPTTGQTASTIYNVTATGIHRTDGEALTNNTATFTGRAGFNVASAASVNTTTMSVTFDAAPDPTSAQTLANYSVPGLALIGPAVLSGNTVTITTAAQAAQTYTVTVTGVKALDNSPLAVNYASFTHVAFNVLSAASVSTKSITVTFDAAPNTAQATNLANYSVVGLTLSGTPTLSGNTVTLTTSTQSATNYTVNVAGGINGVTRATDGTILSTTSAPFSGRAEFDVTNAASTSSGSMTVTFSAPPNATQATNLANYSIPGLTLKGTALLSGNTVTLRTSAQSGTTYTVTVSNVTRNSDGEPLATTMYSFAGTPLKAPTVTNVVVQSTAPDNGTKYYNTGTVTVTITGTEFTDVNCLTQVALNDRNDTNTAVLGTKPTSCSVDSGTQITATFPAGIQTNGSLGWDVIVTNAVGANTSSAVKLVPYAGLLVSEVLYGMGNTGGANQREFVELYNPTTQPIDLTALPLHVHVRNGSGADVDLALTYTNTTIPSHGFFLITSSQSSNDSWWGSRDATYNASSGDLVNQGGVYLSLLAASEQKVIDKVGWGGVSAPWFEGSGVNGNFFNTWSTQRKPAGGQGATTDSDNNRNDFYGPNSSITPLGSSAAPQP